MKQIRKGKKGLKEVKSQKQLSRLLMLKGWANAKGRSTGPVYISPIKFLKDMESILEDFFLKSSIGYSRFITNTYVYKILAFQE